MQINSTLAATNAQPERITTGRQPAQTQGAAAPADSAPASVAPGVSSLSALPDGSAENVNAALPDIASPPEAQSSAAAAMSQILNQSTLAMLAQGGHTPESVLALLAP